MSSCKPPSPYYRICLLDSDFNFFQPRGQMLYRPEKISLLAKVKERSFSGAFMALTLLAMAGWLYLLGTFFLKFVLWCFF